MQLFATHDNVDHSLLGAMEPPAMGVGSGILEGIDYHMNAFIDSLSDMIDGALGKIASGIDKGIGAIGGLATSSRSVSPVQAAPKISAPVVSAPKVQAPAIPEHVRALALASVGAAYTSIPEQSRADEQSHTASRADLGDIQPTAVYQGMQLVIERNQQAGYARSMS